MTASQYAAREVKNEGVKSVGRSVGRFLATPWSSCEQNSGKARGNRGGDKCGPIIAADEEDVSIQIAQEDGDLCEIKGENGERIEPETTGNGPAARGTFEWTRDIAR